MISVHSSPQSPLMGIEARYQDVAEYTYSYCLRHYDKNGQWISPKKAPDTRKTLWLVFGLYGDAENTNAIALGNAIMEALPFKHHSRPRTPEEAASQFDIFITNHAIQLLVVHGDKLSAPVIKKLEQWGRHALHSHPGNRQADYQFHGANDNMPSKATLGLILGGEYFGDDKAIAHGKWNLRQLQSMLTRRGLICEYTSPTYLPLTLLNLLEISQHARDLEAAELAGLCAERIWSDILGHYHVPTRTVGGPYSRSYHMDSTGHFSTMNCLLWLALGDDYAPFNPLEELSREPVRLIHHHTDVTTQLGVLAWLTACPLTPPEYLLNWALEKSYPYRLSADAERIGQVACEIRTQVYAEEDFAIGTSMDEPWTANQAEAFFLQYRRQTPYVDITSLRTVFARFLINDQHPPSQGESDLLVPQAHIQTIQKDRVAMLLPSPKKQLAHENIDTLKFSFIFPTHFGKVDKIELVPAAPDQRCADHVFIQDGPMYIAIRGLNATHWEGCDGPMVEVESTDSGEYQLVTFYNYRGPAREFSTKEIQDTINGAIVIVGLIAEESFGEFRERVLNAKLLDYYAFDQRTITYQFEDTELSASLSSYNNRFRYATVDGRCPDHTRWQADGMPESCLPFLGSKPAHTDIHAFPYEHMNVIWDASRTWQISSSPTKQNRQ